MDTVQYILLRKDLNMRLGKACVQASRACEALQDDAQYEEDESKIALMKSWKTDGTNKRITLYVDSEQQLLDFENWAKELNWFQCGVIDKRLTEFHGVYTYTCLVIGPALTDELKPYFKDLKLA